MVSIDGHVCGLEHWLDALEVTAGGEVTAVDDGADVSPLGVHRTRGVDDEGEFDLAAAGVVPGDLDVVVGVHDDTSGWPFVPDDWGEEGVVEEGDNGTCSWKYQAEALL